MKKTINPIQAWRLAQAKELIKTLDQGVDCPRSKGKIVPSQESLNEISQEYVISDEIPAQQ